MTPGLRNLLSEDYDWNDCGLTALVPWSMANGRYALFLGRLPGGGVAPPATHHGGTDTLVVVAGTVTVETSVRTIRARTGDVVTLPLDERNRLSNVKREDAAYLRLCVPAGDGHRARRGDDGQGERRSSDVPVAGARPACETGRAGPIIGMWRAPARERFQALGAVVEVLARPGGDERGVVLLRATRPSSTAWLSRRRRRPSRPPPGLEFFAGTADGGIHGRLSASPQSAVLMITTSAVTRLLRENCLPECLSLKNSAQQQLLALVRALHGDVGPHGESLQWPINSSGACLGKARAASRRTLKNEMDDLQNGALRPTGEGLLSKERVMHSSRDRVVEFARTDRGEQQALRRRTSLHRRTAGSVSAWVRSGLCAVGAGFVTAVLVGSAVLPMDLHTASTWFQSLS